MQRDYRLLEYPAAICDQSGNWREDDPISAGDFSIFALTPLIASVFRPTYLRRFV